MSILDASVVRSIVTKISAADQIGRDEYREICSLVESAALCDNVNVRTFAIRVMVLLGQTGLVMLEEAQASLEIPESVNISSVRENLEWCMATTEDAVQFFESQLGMPEEQFVAMCKTALDAREKDRQRSGFYDGGEPT